MTEEKSPSDGTTSDLLSGVKAREERQLVDRLREIGLDQYVELPQIAVMGDTSSGKSSLLSALSGVSFPSSDQLTTRCPTQLILSKGDTFRGNVRLMRYRSAASDDSSNDDSSDREELSHMDDVPIAIEKLTKKLVAEGQYISDDQIVIEMCGPDLPNLTLTDLPGLVRTVGDGEEHSIIQRVRQLVDRYMTQERTIIIAVVPANVDMHNTEILQAAQEADPRGVRTIAVVTKLDLVDAGAEKAVHDLLLNKKKFMHLGYHAVKCRSQRDLNNEVSISHGIANEHSFFAQHEYWRRLPRTIWGMKHLSKRLVSILQDNIRRSLPKVIQEINDRVELAQHSLKELGEAFESPSSRRQQFCKWVNQYLRYMEAAINGEYDALPSSERVASRTVSIEPSTSGSTPASRGKIVNPKLRAVLRQKELGFQRAIEKTKAKEWENGKKQVDVCEGTSVEVLVDSEWQTAKVLEHKGAEVLCEGFSTHWFAPARWRFTQHEILKKFIQDNRGDELAIFPSYRVFCNLYRRWVDDWKEPTTALVKDYRVQIKSVSDRMIDELHAASRVEQLFRSTSTDVLARLTDEAAQEMDSLLHVEYRPYTQDMSLFQEVDKRRLGMLHAQFEGLLVKDSDGNVAFGNVMNAFSMLMNSNEEREAREMEIALQAYLEVAIRRFVDSVPMRLNDGLLSKFVTEMEKELMGMTDEKLARLLQDSEQKISARQQLAGELECLKIAKEEIELMVA